MGLQMEDPIVISEEGDLEEGTYRALLVSRPEEFPIDEQVSAQVWDQDSGYTPTEPLFKFLKFGWWEILDEPKPWTEPVRQAE